VAVASAELYASLHLIPDNHANIPPLSFFTGRMPFLPPNQQRQSTEGTNVNVVHGSIHFTFLSKGQCTCLHLFQRLEVADDGVDIDVECGHDKKDTEKKAMSDSVEEVEVEEFFVKYRNL